MHLLVELQMTEMHSTGVKKCQNGNYFMVDCGKLQNKSRKISRTRFKPATLHSYEGSIGTQTGNLPHPKYRSHNLVPPARVLQQIVSSCVHSTHTAQNQFQCLPSWKTMDMNALFSALNSLKTNKGCKIKKKLR